MKDVIKATHMHTPNENGAAQQVDVGVRENALHFIDVFVRETEFFQWIHGVLNVQHQTQFANTNWRIVKGERQFCWIGGDFLQIGQPWFKKIVLQNGQKFILTIYAA